MIGPASRDAAGIGFPNLSNTSRHEDAHLEAQSETEFIRAARTAELHVDIVHERGRFDWSAAGKLRDLVARHNPDIIQTHNTKSHFLLRYSGIWRERTWLSFHHGYTTTDLK